ncbi:substrate-binding periplasmic protein [Paucibacter sp. KCTC 42545]|uniref:substrate-binding periplasmic protein n=1 Tax=Paucibacter sp. KCTC 42545 TaxID=1768242 RepID=UPI000733A627|nr:transporter substrate-binding domain-containing protein [Paucibacter sp. KCTC 42545]ALT78463.1 hypothetical protein AT984_15965 [Paucibacter sp. KCTC 42545]
MDRRTLLISLASPAVLPSHSAVAGSAAESRQISYPVFGGQEDSFRHYCIEVLKLAVEHCGVSYQLKPVLQPVGQGRAIRQLSAGEGPLNILWSMTSAERERDLLPLRFPLDRGLMGWRLLLVRKAEQQRFAQIRSLEELRGLTAVQMHDWPDTQILRANGLQVGTGSSYENLFAMLQHGRTDYFPRSVLEIAEDLERFGTRHDLAIAPGLLLRYPTAFYFFVSPREPALAKDLSLGLERIISNGSWRALFLQHMRRQSKALKLPERQVLALRNPLLPAATPLQRTELWEEPGRLGA